MKSYKRILFSPSEGWKYSVCAIYDMKTSVLTIDVVYCHTVFVEYNSFKTIHTYPYRSVYSWNTELEEGRSYLLKPLSNGFLQAIVIGEENPLVAIKELFNTLKGRIYPYENELTDKFSEAIRLIMENIYKITQDKFYYGFYLQIYNGGGRIDAYLVSTENHA